MRYKTQSSTVDIMTQLTSITRDLRARQGGSTAKEVSSGVRPHAVLAVAFEGLVLSSLDLFIVNVALPQIARSFHDTNLGTSRGC